jgi:hypothetical protein
MKTKNFSKMMATGMMLLLAPAATATPHDPVECTGTVHVSSDGNYFTVRVETNPLSVDSAANGVVLVADCTLG